MHDMRKDPEREPGTCEKHTNLLSMESSSVKARNEGAVFPLALTAAARCEIATPLADGGGNRSSRWEPGHGSRARCRVLLAVPPIAAGELDRECGRGSRCIMFALQNVLEAWRSHAVPTDQRPVWA